MDKFYRLERYLKSKSEESFALSFDDIENIVFTKNNEEKNNTD